MATDKKTDIRVKKTYKKLVDGMLDLLSKEMLENISVLEICEVSGVHRATFYKHFDDKYAFLKFFFERLLKELPCDKISGDITSEECKSAYKTIISNVVSFTESHRQLIKNVTDISQSQLFVAMFTDAVTELLEGILNSRVECGIEMSSPVPMIASFYASAMVGLLRWWVISGDKFSASDVEEFANLRLEELAKLYEMKK
ncbi:MAG: TetR/AcrR family transcriptional regulator [Clostridia bacterium]|nr:TetR/AcrR family transcriptional regulator [Clostridia bacterium]